MDGHDDGPSPPCFCGRHDGARGVLLLALVAAAFAAVPVAIALATAVFALVVGLRSRGRRWWPRHSRPARWSAAEPPLIDGPSWTTAWDAQPMPSDLPATRMQVTAVLTEWDVHGEAAEPTLLVVTELLTNAVEHARPPLRVTLRLGHEFVRVEMCDATPSHHGSTRRRPRVAATAGRSSRRSRCGTGGPRTRTARRCGPTCPTVGPSDPLTPFRPGRSGAAGSLAAVPTAQLPGVGELLEAAVTAVGGTRREGQDTMAQAVRSAIATGEHVAVQAGTGTGKSLAYLVPAIHHAVEKNSTVVVSTATIALQRQLVDRDLPRVAKALKPLLGRTPTFAILKGRRNYLCLNKLHGGDENPEDELFDPFQISAMGRAVKRIHEWADDHRDRRPRRARARACPTARGGWCRSPRASASARRSAPSATSASPSAPAPRPGGPTSSSPTTRCWPSTPWTGVRCCPSTTWWWSTRRTSWSTGSPASPPAS